jgi:hypothetical protein
VSFVPAGRDINFKVAATLLSGSTFRNGDWLSATLSACLRVSSKIASPVVLEKSVRTMVSFSVNVAAGRGRKWKTPATNAAITRTAAGTKIFQSFLPSVTGTSATLAAANDPAAGTETDEGMGCWTTEVICWLPLSSAARTVPELASMPCRDSVSRFSRFRSARMSAAC